jgi:hypothetical protein
MIGYLAGGGTTNGNVCIGFQAGNSVNLGSNTICIGNSTAAAGAGNNAIVLGNQAANITTAPTNSIILNASGSALNPTIPGFYATGISGISSTGLTPASSTSTGAIAGYGMVLYNPSTCCLQYVYS